MCSLLLSRCLPPLLRALTLPRLLFLTATWDETEQLLLWDLGSMGAGLENKGGRLFCRFSTADRVCQVGRRKHRLWT